MEEQNLEMNNETVTQPGKAAQVIGFGVWLLVSFAASFVGALASIQAKDFYGQLIQPEWAPPPWLFGPVWTVLYAMMGVSAWLVWCRGGVKGNRLAFVFFFSQLALNALWSWIFFTWKMGQAAMIDIILLWLLILVTIILFWRVSRIAGILLVPYILWVTFATCLNWALWRLNSGSGIL